ncbi:MAG: CAP domain-containing protein [Microthrixaceae bacterium]
MPVRPRRPRPVGRVRQVLAIAVLAASVVVAADARSGLSIGRGATPVHGMRIALVLEDLVPERPPPPPVTTTTVPPPPPPTTTTAAPRPAAPPPPAPAVMAQAAAPVPVVTAADAEARALQLLNQARANNGLPALALNTGARAVGRAWSTQMARTSLAHNPDLAGDLERAGVTGWQRISENVGDGGSVDQLHSMFMASSSHRVNMLSDQVSEVGIGVVTSGGRVWLTMDFVGW